MMQFLKELSSESSTFAVSADDVFNITFKERKLIEDYIAYLNNDGYVDDKINLFFANEFADKGICGCDKYIKFATEDVVIVIGEDKVYVTCGIFTREDFSKKCELIVSLMYCDVLYSFKLAEAVINELESRLEPILSPMGVISTKVVPDSGRYIVLNGEDIAYINDQGYFVCVGRKLKAYSILDLFRRTIPSCQNI